MRLARWALLVALVGCGGAKPGGGPKVCTDVGCEDQFMATLEEASGALPTGMQTLTVTADGVTTTCSFTLPLETPTGVGAVDCPSGIELLILEAQSCTSTTNGTTKTLSCTPIAGHFSEELTIRGKPATVHLTQTSNGATLVDVTVAPAYQMHQPNGPGCDPICSQASGGFVLAAQ
jgi:hypothetical protein